MAPSIAKDALGSGSSLSPATKSTSLNPFETLVSDLSRILGPSSGLDSSEVDVKQLQKLMESYESSEEDWRRYAFEDLSRGYTRNLVDEGNGKSNLVSEMFSIFHFVISLLNLRILSVILTISSYYSSGHPIKAAQFTITPTPIAL